MCIELINENMLISVSVSPDIVILFSGPDRPPHSGAVKLPRLLPGLQPVPLAGRLRSLRVTVRVSVFF